MYLDTKKPSDFGRFCGCGSKIEIKFRFLSQFAAIIHCQALAAICHSFFPFHSRANPCPRISCGHHP